jgi:hypothetical protein
MNTDSQHRSITLVQRQARPVPVRMVASWRRCPTCGSKVNPADFPATGPCYVCDHCNAAWAKQDLKRFWREKEKREALSNPRTHTVSAADFETPDLEGP